MIYLLVTETAHEETRLLLLTDDLEAAKAAIPDQEYHPCDEYVIYSAESGEEPRRLLWNPVRYTRDPLKVHLGTYRLQGWRLAWPRV